MNAKLTTVVLLLAAGAASALPLGPRERAFDAPAIRAHGVPRTTPYATTSVAHPGRVEGAVTWSGALPALAALPVPAAIGQTNRACGTSTPNPSLDVDAASRGVRNAVVYLADVAHGAPATSAPVTVEQEHCAFGPHVIATTVGGALRFGNRDSGILHNLHGYYGLTGDDAMFNVASPPGLTLNRAIDREGVHRIVCDAGHTWMLLYVHAFDHPYYAVTDATGHFSLPNVPPGNYHLHVWHEGWTSTGNDAHGRPVWSAPVETEQAIRVTPDATVAAAFEYNAAPAAIARSSSPRSGR